MLDEHVSVGCGRFGSTHILSPAECARYDIPDCGAPGRPAPYLNLWITMPDQNTSRPNQDSRPYMDKVLWGRWEAFAKPDLGYYFARGCSEYFGGRYIYNCKKLREPRDQSNLYAHPDELENDMVALFRMPTERLLLPSALKSYGIEPMPGMIYVRVPSKMMEHDVRNVESCQHMQGGLFADENTYTATVQDSGSCCKHASGRGIVFRSASDHNNGAKSYALLYDWRKHGSQGYYDFWRDWQEQAMSGKQVFRCFCSHFTGEVIPPKYLLPYDIEIATGMRYVHTDSAELKESKEIILAFPFRPDASAFTAMRAALAETVRTVYLDSVFEKSDPNRKAACEFVRTLGDCGSGGTIDVQIPRGPLAEILPKHPPVQLDSWLSSANWQDKQLVLLAFLIGGDRWQNVLKLMQGQDATTLRFL